jgi:hypothetical protein
LHIGGVPNTVAAAAERRSVHRSWSIRATVSAGLVGIAVAVTPAHATHARPKGATPFSAPLVTAYDPCSSANRMHAAPLAAPSCAPPVRPTAYSTVGTPDSNGAPAQSVGSVRMKVLLGPPADVLETVDLTDVRCTSSTAICGAANDAGLPDFKGLVRAIQTIRITDHGSGPGFEGGTEPATMSEIPFYVDGSCAATDSTIGAHCTASSTWNAVVPNAFVAGRREVIALGPVQLFDSGPDNRLETADNFLLASQGLFVP